MEKEDLSGQESLQLIARMINQAKKNIVDGSFYFLFWGYLTFFCYIGHFILIKIDFYAPFYVWLLTIPGAIISFIHGYKKEENAMVVTYIDRLYSKVWLSLSVPLIAFIVFGAQLGHQNTTGLILLLAGIGVFLTGQLMKFNLSIYGSLILWLGAILALIYNNEYQFLIGAAVIIPGYLIPGHILRNKERNG